MRIEALGFAVLLALPAAAAAAPDPVVVLRWDAVPAASGYELEISEDSTFAAPSVTVATDAPLYGWHALPARACFWRVRCRFTFGRVGPWSGVKTIAAAVTPVVSTDPPDGAEVVATGALAVSFVSQRTIAEYRLEISSDPTFANASTGWRGAASPATAALPSPGIWYWRLGGTDVLGREVTPGPAHTVTARPDAPRLVGPAPDALARPGTTFLRWEPVAGARAYVVDVVAPDGEDTRGEVAGTSLTVDAEPGEWSWTVRAVTPDGIAGFASARSPFRIEEPPAAAPAGIALAPVPAAARRGSLGGLAGLRATPDSGPLAAVELAVEPFGDARARVAVDVSGFEARASAGGRSARGDVAANAITGRRVFHEAPLDLEIGAGPSLTAALVGMRDGRRLVAGAGGVVMAGASVPAGPGAMFLRLQWGEGRLAAPGSRFYPGGAALFVGWRIER